MGYNYKELEVHVDNGLEANVEDSEQDNTYVTDMYNGNNSNSEYDKYGLINRRNSNRKYKKKNSRSILKILFVLLFAIGVVMLCKAIFKNSEDDENERKKEKFKIVFDRNTGQVITEGEPRMDKNGIDLNTYIVKGMYSQGFDNIPIKEIEDWSLYVPPCQHLKPIHHPDKYINPDCSTSSLQFVNPSKNTDLPYSLQLQTINDLVDKFDDWKDDKDSKVDENQDMAKLLDENYHPYDYGVGDSRAKIENTSDDILDEHPNPEDRRLFSFISFDVEFDLLDVYLAENYEIVDYFVIFESNSTLKGDPKPLYFTRTLLESDRYKYLKDKIIPFPYEMPESKDDKEMSEDKIISSIMIENGLRAVHARHGDLFVYGTVGEIPKPYVLARLKKCGGWEHLYSGISSKKEKRENDANAMKENPIAFSSWNYKYSFEEVENNDVGTILRPNLAIFDARNRKSSDDPYQSYKNFDVSSRNASLDKHSNAVLWSAGWYMNNIFPNLDHIYHRYMATNNSEKKDEDELVVKYGIKTKILNNEYIFSDDKDKSKFVKRVPRPKIASRNGYTYSFDYSLWKEKTKNVDRDFSIQVEILKHEIPIQVGWNSICYSYMFDRQFGLNKTVWWDAVPRSEWKSVDLDKVDYNTVGYKIAPWVTPADLNELKIMSSVETINEIVNNRKSISRFGDGEYSMIMHNNWKSNYQKDDQKLIDALVEILHSEDEKFIVAIPDTFHHDYNALRTDGDFWSRYDTGFGPELFELHNMNKQYGSAMMSRFYNEMKDKSHVPEYIKVLKTLWNDKDIIIIEGSLTRIGIGNDLLDNAKSIQRIICPAINAYDAYDKIYQEAIKQDKNKPMFISLGQTATRLAYDLYKAGFQAIDLGHADIEYEWYVRKTNDRIRIPYKYVNEASGGRDNIEDVTDENYFKQIIANITIS